MRQQPLRQFTDQHWRHNVHPLWLWDDWRNLTAEEGPSSGTPYPYRKEKEAHELLFLWWLAVLLVGTWARTHDMQDGGHTQANRLTKTCTLGLYRSALTLDILVMVNWHPSKQGIRWPVSRDHNADSSFGPFRWPVASGSSTDQYHETILQTQV